MLGSQDLCVRACVCVHVHSYEAPSCQLPDNALLLFYFSSQANHVLRFHVKRFLAWPTLLFMQRMDFALWISSTGSILAKNKDKLGGDGF